MLIGKREVVAKAPEFLGGAESYVFRIVGSAFMSQSIIDTKTRTYEYARQLSARLTACT